MLKSQSAQFEHWSDSRDHKTSRYDTFSVTALEIVSEIVRPLFRSEKVYSTVISSSTSDGRLVDKNGDRLDLLPPVDPVQVVDLEALKTLKEDASQGCQF